MLDEDDVTQKTLQSYNKAEADPNSKITVTPAGQLRVAFNGLGRIVNQGIADHIRHIDIDSVVSGEARPLRIIVDDRIPPPGAPPRCRNGRRARAR